MDLDYPFRTHGARPQTGRASMNQPSREEAAESLREQAEACRRLARKARTWAGSCALGTAAETFDDDARKIDPNSLRR